MTPLQRAIAHLKEHGLSSQQRAQISQVAQVCWTISLKSKKLSDDAMIKPPHIQQELISLVKVDEAKLNKNLIRLYNAWMQDDVPDSEAARVICPALKNNLNIPIFIAIIGDCVAYFQQNEIMITPEKALELACLCGANQIGDYLIKKYPAFIKYDFILPYAISSDNSAWVRKLAEQQITAGLTFPDRVYLYGEPQLAQEIEQSFKKQLHANLKSS